MERCATCRWWTEPWDAGFSEEWRVPPGWRVCAKADMANAVEDREGQACVPVSTMAYAVDAYAHEATLLTGPDFGCVQWEAKQT